MNDNESERKGAETTLEYLERVKKMGYLFHGSTDNQIQELEPRYTFDPQSKNNTDRAVFATNNITLTTIFGLYGGHKGWSTYSKNNAIVSRIPISHKGLVEKTIGSVYVLSPDTFKKIGNGEQFKSQKKIMPIKRVDVTIGDYYKLGGKIEWF